MARLRQQDGGLRPAEAAFLDPDGEPGPIRVRGQGARRAGLGQLPGADELVAGPQADLAPGADAGPGVADRQRADADDAVGVVRRPGDVEVRPAGAWVVRGRAQRLLSPAALPRPGDH